MSFFGQNIRFLRNRQQMSQSAFAELFGLKRTAVGAYEEERAEPKVELFVKIANHFGISLEDLLCRNLQESGISAQAAVYRGIPYVSADEIPDFSECVAGGNCYEYRRYVQIPGIGDGLVAFEYGHSILIVGERQWGEGLFMDVYSKSHTLLLRQTGITLATGNVSDADAVKAFEIRYVIKRYNKDDHTETMLEDISERISRIELRME